MRIALASLDQAWEDKAKNRKRVSKLVKDAATAGAALVVFPEMTLTGFTMSVNSVGEDRNDSETVKFFRELAVGSTAIAFGVVHLEADKGLNKMMVVGRNGDILADYMKIHPFSYALEDQFFNSGDTIISFDLDNFRIGCTICFDLRFPALYQSLSCDCSVIVNIANWPQSRLEHWDTLLRARAIENQVFMVGVNRTGVDGNGIIYARSSKVYGPYGEIVPPEIIQGALDIVNLKREVIIAARQAFPVSRDRRNDLYARLYSGLG